jgi:3-oxoacyl-[acyl-carrier protein] reductase
MPMVRLRDGGRIVTLGSVSGVIGNRGQVNYSASKAGLIGATKALAREVAKRGITVNCVAPGFIQTDMLAALPKEELEQMVPLRRLGQPEEVAALVAFLFSDEAGYMTAQVLGIDGGMT